jgi:hypothetical protein
MRLIELIDSFEDHNRIDYDKFIYEDTALALAKEFYIKGWTDFDTEVYVDKELGSLFYYHWRISPGKRKIVKVTICIADHNDRLIWIASNCILREEEKNHLRERYDILYTNSNDQD